MTDPDENAQVTKTLKGGEGKLITQRDVCNNAEIQRKPTPNKRAKMAGVCVGWQRDHRFHRDDNGERKQREGD